jgi:hypothetical protein
MTNKNEKSISRIFEAFVSFTLLHYKLPNL